MNIMTLQVHSIDVNCATGVNITLNGVAQVKINGVDKGNLNLACQHFLDMKEDEMTEILTRTMEGHQRSIISTMSVEEVFRDRIKFAERVHEVASIDLMKMGIQIVSYTLSSVKTSNGYLEALGKPATALVIRDARIGEANCTRDSDIATAQANEEKDKAVYASNKAIESQQNVRDLVVEENKKEINRVKAIANNATRLATAQMNQSLVHERMAIELIEKKGEARVMDQELKLQDKFLTSDIKIQAETDKYIKETEAEASKIKDIYEAEAEAQKIQMVGDAKAEAIQAKAQAEAKALQLKANAYEQYGKAALVGEVIKTLPKMACEVAQPLMAMEKVTLISSGNGHVGVHKMVKEVMTIMNEVPHGVDSITGINLKAEIQKVMAR